MAYKINSDVSLLTVQDGRPVFTHFSQRPPVIEQAGDRPGSSASTSPRHEPRTPTARTPSAQPNAFPGTCGTCGKQVAPGAGTRKRKDGAWSIVHLEGQCPAAAKPVPAASPAKVSGSAVSIPIPPDTELRPGIFTLDNVEGSHLTIRIRRQRVDDKFLPGVDLIGFLAGTSNTKDYETFGQIKEGRLVIWKRYSQSTRLITGMRQLVEDPDSARECSLCIRCGAVLTHPHSTWMGPECRKKS